MLIKKENIMFERDSDGKLIPQTVDLVIHEPSDETKELEDGKIIIIPIPRGELKKYIAEALTRTDKDVDAEIISKYCINPQFTLDETKDIKPLMAGIIVNTILEYSGVPKRNGNTTKESVLKAEDAFAKN